METEAPALWRKPSATATPSTLDKRASPRLYCLIRREAICKMRLMTVLQHAPCYLVLSDKPQARCLDFTHCLVAARLGPNTMGGGQALSRWPHRGLGTGLPALCLVSTRPHSVRGETGLSRVW